MLRGFWHLFLRAGDTTVAAMGTTWVGLILGNLIPFAAFTAWQRPWKHGRRRKMKDLGRGVAVVAGAWTIALVWFAAKVVYEDHRTLVSANGELARENTELAKERASRKEQVTAPVNQATSIPRPPSVVKPAIQRASLTSIQFARPEPLGGFPFVPNTDMWLRVTVTNHGTETAHRLNFSFFVDVVGQPTSPAIEDVVWKSTETRSPFQIVKSENDLGNSDYRFVDEVKRLGAEEIPGLRAGNYSLFATGIARYSDHVGVLVSELCVHLIPGSDFQKPLLWRRCVNHNRVGVTP